ncbi:fasciclin domain-containing protein [Fodinibius salsisoli]|uniref:Fasciclin domain-containing protein n=1 Tax=Fodinibius salsisoli TaxID=2820877 RepID=A0ABT3PNC4_9BACT|nr:fasciclin domain-containing protein [Fodinibius salsisoli]
MLTSCLDSSTNSGQQRQNILETAKEVTQGQGGDQVLTTFVGLLEDADLDSTVANNGPLTVIAPTNDAFSNLPEGLLDSLETPDLVNILRYHVVEEIVNYTQISGEEEIQSMLGENLFFERVQGATQDSLFINNSYFLGGLQATNGLIFVVDEVLFPDTYLNAAGLIAKRPQLNSLESAIEGANLTTTLSDTTAAYTVFAPTNEALENTDLSGDEIQYHVLPEKVFSNGLSSGTYTTLSGEDITVEVSGGTITLNGEATITEANIEGTNGVVHIIDMALSPPSE